MKTAIKTALAVVAGAAAISGVASIPSLVSAWGDSNGGRPSYSLQEVNEGKLGNNIVFNSITIAESDYAWYREHYGKEMPVGTITHEKNYVGAREDTGKNEGAYNVWQGNDIKVEDGKTYIIRLYVHNNNPNGLDAIARNTKVYFNIPTESAMQVKVNGYIHADNANPTDYIDYINFNSDHAFHLEYVYGSALIESNGKVGGSTLNDNIVSPSTGGVLIGYDALDGNVPGCYQYSSYITIKVKAVYDNEFYVENKVRLADLNSDPSWKNEVDANIGDKVEFQVQYKNLSDVRQPGVTIRNVLPEGLRYVEGSTYLYNTLHPNGIQILEDNVISNGIIIGNYAAGANAYVRITAEVVGDTLACGKTMLVDWAQGQAGPDADYNKQIVLQDYARVNVVKVCDGEDPNTPVTPEDPGTDLPSKLPTTGPEAIAGGIIATGSIATAAGYYIASRRQLR